MGESLLMKNPPPNPPSGGSSAEDPLMEFLSKALQQQIDNNTKLVHIVVDLTHKLEQAAIVIDGLNRTIESYEKGEGT